MYEKSIMLLGLGADRHGELVVTSLNANPLILPPLFV